MKGHPCPLCGAAGVPVFLAACRPCYATFPRPIAIRLAFAYRNRVIDQPGYQEAVAAVLQWAADRNTNAPGERD